MPTERAAADVLDPKQLLKVLTAVKRGDFAARMPVDRIGVAGKIADTLNDIIALNQGMVEEFGRVSRAVGREGKIRQRAAVVDARGSWADCVNSVNELTEALVQPTLSVARVIGAVAKGDLSQRMELEVEDQPLKGEFLRTASTINGMVEQLGSFAGEITRVAREVGTEGKLGGQARVEGVSGIWKDLTDNVNQMAANLTSQVRNIAEVTTAVASGDLSKKITVDVKGEILDLKNTINTMVDQLNAFAGEVTRVAREVGTEGRLGGQAEVKGVAGVWKGLTDNVNQMAANLTSQVRNIAEVTTAVARGDLSKKITVDVKGEILALKNTINTMLDQLNTFAGEVTRVAREVGTEGKLGGQAKVKGVGGTWKDLTDNVNQMAANLTSQVRNIAEVTTAVASGDLSKKITVDVKGEILDLKNTINAMVDRLGDFSSEVTRVAREVGTEGELGGQARVKGVAGTWKDLTDSVNRMAANLTSQVRNIAEVTTAVAQGDLSKKITVKVKGEVLALKDTINTMVDQLNAFAGEVTRVAREVGTEGKLGGQAKVKGVAGTWKDLTDNVNQMAANLTVQLRDVSKVATAIASGDLRQKITVDVKGEILQIKETINTMVDQLNAFAFEVTRVAREVGTEGRLGGQATVKGVGGTWKDLTDNVNQMAGNLTAQVRNIAEVTTAVARGDLNKKITVDVRGEILDLKNTINTMVDRLGDFASEVTRVAREVGTDGKLGGQATVQGVSGTWKGLTDSVNQLAGNLTTQVRAIAEVATAVTKGDLTRSITVEAAGEVAELKDNINRMIGTLKVTTGKTTEQDWLKSNLAKFTRMLQGQRDLMTVAKSILSELSPLIGAQHAVFCSAGSDGDGQALKLLASYAYKERKTVSSQFKVGEGLIGQCALEKQRILVTQVPPDYIQINSGLGEATPHNIVVLPVLFEGKVRAVLELSSFTRFSEIQLAFLEQFTESLGIVMNSIEGATRTEDLLKKSQTLAEELQSQQEELSEANKRLEEQQKDLQTVNEELEERAKLLGEQKKEVEQARTMLEEKAQQLALTSKYKSEFLANMSHELRTPLNSMLILSETLKDDPEGTPKPKQIEYANTIHSAGTDLLNLINDILDLSKIEAGSMDVDVGPIPFPDLRDFIERTFRPVSEAKSLKFAIELAPDLPPAVQTDSKRLQQILKNLLSNAFKFTQKGAVELRVARATKGWRPDHETLNRARTVISFAVRDTGIGIPKDKHMIIFEAFQQADASTSRKYGGTGLGLSISRELARLLGGQIRLESEPGQGSTFTLYLPLDYEAPPRVQIPTEPGAAPLWPRPKEPPAAGPLSPTVIEESAEAEPEDDRHSIRTGDRVLLIVEDDPNFASILLDLARERGFKGLTASRANRALDMVKQFKPVALTLDLRLPDADGWVVLDRVKHDPATRHIPVHIISVEEDWQRGLKMGAFAFLHKPATREDLQQAFEKLRDFAERQMKRLLIVEDDEAHRKVLVELVGNGDVEVTAVGTGAEAIAALQGQGFDCMVLDLGLPDISGFQLIERLKKDERLRDLPIVIYTGRDLTRKEQAELRKVTEAIIIKDVKSPERLLDETALFLHRVEADLPEPKRQMLERAKKPDPLLAGKRVLVVDDDVRNIFSLTAVLERHKMEIAGAESGKEALSILEKGPDVDAILMDIMMPEMDGYETMRAVRKNPRYKKLPIIALTAKAMKGDREKCIDAGASDYIAKPVDTDQLLSLLRVWLYR